MGTISKALEMLNYFSRKRPEIGLSEFVRLTGRDKATVHRHLVELEKNGFLEQHPASRAYRLGPAILRLTGVREASNPVRRILRPIVTGLAEQTGELAHASLLQGNVLSPVFHADPLAHGVQVHFDEAELLPLHATSSGLAVLAFAGPKLRKQILSADLQAFTANTIVDPDTLSMRIEEVRHSGFSYSDRAFDGEVTSQAAPIFDETSEVIGALSVAVPAVRAHEERLRTIATALTAAARSATRSLGGSYPEL
ncbi:IclR family transcriptional regulator [Roseibium salinum]|uniref:IclR family transcriptional regulator n=1 Tax=Roseibium salinum TaxID=1604349 RepID=A0ABT3QVZ3_9HYPH|nr:IclR family transcriptional regulator [Roseibium sp. DSM 29163]MCX2721095.1 IclR family transcriptional regulator [Roseibium sp. DSM 29163]MDN3722557.1 IclR family transcriptional regulator [Roseibium salinum]